MEPLKALELRSLFNEEKIQVNISVGKSNEKKKNGLHLQICQRFHRSKLCGDGAIELVSSQGPFFIIIKMKGPSDIFGHWFTKETNKQTNKPNQTKNCTHKSWRDVICPSSVGMVPENMLFPRYLFFQQKKKVFVRGLKRHPQMHHGNLQFLKTRH